LNNFGSAAWTDAGRHVIDDDQLSANPKVLFDPPFYEFRVADFTLTIIIFPRFVFHSVSFVCQSGLIRLAISGGKPSIKLRPGLFAGLIPE